MRINGSILKQSRYYVPLELWFIVYYYKQGRSSRPLPKKAPAERPCL